jgi:hypothetical protein
MQLPIGFKLFILNKALEELDPIKNKDLITAIKDTIKNNNFNSIIYRLNKALYSLKQASRQ